ncbi:hypothetical protein LCI18_002586 [Fusarium solani-melongenae]|uniref:Uncharacterized protein n=1 Tax=Fusarium solani subsp. cucurbitae TaxID=2747967 RepID=A0ACD3YRY5_FUSSC|nr:hypothetical protein LCI18_002586 [Fusarium solani-melongenae]
MTSTTSDEQQQDSLHNFTFPDHQFALRDERAPPASGEPTDNALWISDDNSSDIEDEDHVEHHNLNRQVIDTAAISDSMCTKHSDTESDAVFRMGATAVLSPARLEGVRILSHESQMDLSTDPESIQQALCSTTCTPTGDTTAGADTDSGISSIGPEIQSCRGASDGEVVTKATRATREPDVMIDAPSDEESCHQSQNAPASPLERTYGPVAATPR